MLRELSLDEEMLVSGGESNDGWGGWGDYGSTIGGALGGVYGGMLAGNWGISAGTTVGTAIGGYVGNEIAAALAGAGCTSNVDVMGNGFGNGGFCGDGGPSGMGADPDGGNAY